MFKKKNQKGFTLIELLIVVAILGILAAVIIPNVSRFMKTGTLNAANTEAQNMRTAAMAYFAEYNAWPSDSAALVSANFTTTGAKAVYTFLADGTFNDVTTNNWGSGITWDKTAQKWK